MRRGGLRLTGVALAMLGLGLTGATASEPPPLPRAKPALSLAQPPSEPGVTIPLPRPRPVRSEAPPEQTESVASLAFSGPLRIASGGRIDVSLADLDRERDPATSSRLAPSAESKWSMADAKSARDRCAFVLAASNLDAESLEPIGGPDGCGIAAPLKVAAFGAASVSPAATLNCPMAFAVYTWMTKVVQPAAREVFGKPVVAVRNASSYTCRRRNNARRVRISEHAFGNALDIAAFELASGKLISVQGHWSAATADASPKAKFLKAVHGGACGIFSVVIGPRANSLHEDHLHVDLGRAGEYKYCK